jgi:Na+-driven multidrug efflux pump
MGLGSKHRPCRLLTTIALSSIPYRYTNTNKFKDGNPALVLSKSILKIRCLSLLPQVLSFVAFSAFRGTMDLQSCVKISLLANSLNIILTPILIHVFQFGVTGSALASLLCDCLTAVSYIKLMRDRRFLILENFKLPSSWEQITPLVRGSALQARSLAMHITNLIVVRKIQSFDSNADGVAPAAFALAMQTFFMGSVIIFAMGMATQTLYPTAIANSPDQHHNTDYRGALVHRLLYRGGGIGILVSFIQGLLMPLILRSTPIPAVRQAAIFPIMVVIALQPINGLTNVGEGIIIGSGKFTLASAILVAASIGYMALIQQWSPTLNNNMGINGVFLCMGAYHLLRLGGVLAVLPSIINPENAGNLPAHQKP